MKKIIVLWDVQYIELPLDTVVSQSTCAIVGTYKGIDEYSEYVYYCFDVDNVVYGTIPTNTVKVYDLRTALDMDNRYDYDEQYILILNEIEPTIYDTEIKYSETSAMNKFPIDGPYMMYGDEVSIPEGTDFISYIASIYEETHDGEEAGISALSEDPETYDTTEAEIIGKSAFIGYVTINEMVFETPTYTNTYVCTVDELLQGENLNVTEDGTVYMAITKDLVEVGEIYLIGFNPADTDSVIYSMSTLQSVTETDSALANSITSALETE